MIASGFDLGWGKGVRSFDFMRCACSEAGAGSSPRRASHFLCLAKESNQRKATPLRASLRFAAGNLRCSLQAGSAQTRFAQTRAALDSPEAALLGTRRGDMGRAIASLGHRRPRYAKPGTGHADALEREHEHEHEHEHERMHLHVRVRERQREQGPGAHANLHPTQGRAMARWTPSPLCACRGAELFAEKGPRVFEPKASLRGPREKRAPQVARSEAEGHAQWGRLSLVTFFGETKKVTRPPGRNPGSCLNPTATPKQANERPHLTPPPQGKGEGPRPQ
ncbi:hypothetical protein RA8CHR_00350 [Variovorax sp. RA8]|nr:hypothetical protein RA8CHR_00350 [Variovorax sp. RA8]